MQNSKLSVMSEGQHGQHGNGTINIMGKGKLFHIEGRNGVARKLTLDGVTLVGIADNDSPLVSVWEGGELVMVSGAITGNGGGSVRTDQGTFTMSGGFVEGSEIQWTLATKSEEIPSFMGSVVYGNGRFIAMMRPEGYERWPIPPTQKMLYSTDGITWTVKDTELREYGNLTFSNGRLDFTPLGTHH